jgi:hypothetical protein
LQLIQAKARMQTSQTTHTLSIEHTHTDITQAKQNKEQVPAGAFTAD